MKKGYGVLVKVTQFGDTSIDWFIEFENEEGGYLKSNAFDFRNVITSKKALKEVGETFKKYWPKECKVEVRYLNTNEIPKGITSNERRQELFDRAVLV